MQVFEEGRIGAVVGWLDFTDAPCNLLEGMHEMAGTIEKKKRESHDVSLRIYLHMQLPPRAILS